MYHSSATSYRSFKSPFKTKATSRSDKKNPSDSQSNRSNDTPLTFAEKLDRWKRRMSTSSSSSGTPVKNKNVAKSSNFQKCASESKRRNSFALRSRRLKSASPSKRDVPKEKEKYESRVDSSKQPRAVEEDHRIYEEVIEEFGKMTSTKSDEDQHTANTETLTNPKYSFDDGSTIVSEEAAHHYIYHSFKSGNQVFTVDKRYSHIRTVGSGAYGVVISAKDFASPNKVAIKMIPRAFHDEVDAKRILREIKLLKHFRHENIISILDMMPPLAKQVENFNDVYIVTDLMETDLHRIIYSKQSLSIEHVQYFVYQILRALKYMHSANVIHRDLKPSNLLVNSNCDLKVCDFGLARGILETHDDCQLGEGDTGATSMLLTEYVVTRWYRAPEIMLACHQYSKPVDMWSVGCIFAELLSRKPFLPGEDYIDQLTRISGKLGKLSEEDLDFVTSEKAKRFMRRLPDKAVQPLRRQFPDTPPDAIDLLGKMLQVHPRKRINVVEALEHPFLKSLHSREHEHVAHAPFDFSFEDEKLHRVRLQELIWQEIGDFRPTCLPVPQRYYCAQVGDSFAKKLCPP